MTLTLETKCTSLHSFGCPVPILLLNDSDSYGCLKIIVLKQFQFLSLTDFQSNSLVTNCFKNLYYKIAP